MVRSSLGLLLPLLIGLPFTLWLPTWPMRVAMGFLCGMVVITAAVIVTGVASGRVELAGLGGLGLAWIVAAAISVRRRRALLTERPEWPTGWGWPAWALLALTALDVVTAAGYAFKTPISDYDVTAFWLPKSQAIATGGLQALGHSLFPDYPPLWPIQMALANSGTSWFKLVPSAYLIATLVIAFEHVRARVGPTWAAAATLAISGVPYVWQPYGVNDLMSEIPTMAFLTASAVMLAQYVEKPSASYAAVAAATAIGLAWVRPDGFLYAFAIAAGLVLVGLRDRTRIKPPLAAAGAIVLAYVAWRIFIRFVLNASVLLQPNLSALTPATVIGSVLDTIRYVAANLGNPYLFGPALIAFAIIALGLRNARVFGVIAAVMAVDLAIGVALYVALPSTDIGQPLIWWLTTGFKRMAMHIVPLLYIAAALALGSWWRRSDAGSVSRALTIAGLTASLVVLCMAGYAAYRVGGPKTYDLSVMYPSHVYGPDVDYSTPGVMAVPTDGGTDPRIVFYLINTGRRVPPLDNITGTFSRFSAEVGVQGASDVGEEFIVTADSTVIARELITGGNGRGTVGADIPIGTRLLELSVSQKGSGTATASWIQPTVQRASAWWLVEVLLAASGALTVASAALVLGSVSRSATTVDLIARRLLPAALLGAAAIQQVEATGALLVPTWSFAARLLGHL